MSFNIKIFNIIFFYILMSKTQNIIYNNNKRLLNKKIENLQYSSLEKTRNINRNKKNENKIKEKNSQKSTKEITQRNSSMTVDEENIIVKIIENNNNNSSISKLNDYFNQSNLNYSKIHHKKLYNDNKDNFIFNTIIMNNKTRINNISEKLSSMKNPNEISTKESSLYGYVNNKNFRSRNSKNKIDEKVKLSCCFFKKN